MVTATVRAGEPNDVPRCCWRCPRPSCGSHALVKVVRLVLVHEDVHEQLAVRPQPPRHAAEQRLHVLGVLNHLHRHCSDKPRHESTTTRWRPVHTESGAGDVPTRSNFPSSSGWKLLISAVVDTMRHAKHQSCKPTAPLLLSAGWRRTCHDGDVGQALLLAFGLDVLALGVGVGHARDLGVGVAGRHEQHQAAPAAPHVQDLSGGRTGQGQHDNTQAGQCPSRYCPTARHPPAACHTAAPWSTPAAGPPPPTPRTWCPGAASSRSCTFCTGPSQAAAATQARELRARPPALPR